MPASPDPIFAIAPYVASVIATITAAICASFTYKAAMSAVAINRENAREALRDRNYENFRKSAGQIHFLAEYGAAFVASNDLKRTASELLMFLDPTQEPDRALEVHLGLLKSIEPPHDWPQDFLRLSRNVLKRMRGLQN